MKNKKGFSFIEFMIIITIIIMLATAVLSSSFGARQRALDTKKIQQINTVEKAVVMYLAQNGQYPTGDGDGSGGWDVGNRDLPFIPSLGSFMGQSMPRDLIKTGNNAGYFYYRYPAGYAGCPSERGAFYVLGITTETPGAAANSPGWSCPDRNWQDEFGWVTGGFEQ